MAGLGLAASVGDTVQATVLSGSMLLAIPLAVIAGVVSFASPCVLPLVPGYLGFVSGMAGGLAPGSGATAAAPRRTGLAAVRRGRLLVGVALFVAGFTVVFVVLGVLAGSVGQALLSHADVITRVLGVVVVLMGLVFAGWLPIGQRERRIHLAPTAGLWGAPLLGLVFGLGWVPCIGPTLVAVYTLALDQASAGRGATLSVAYCLGLGLPFVLVALFMERSRRALAVLRDHKLAVMRVGGGLLVLVGLALVTGLWTALTDGLQGLVGGFEPVV
ncbi:cytochrome c biogenesis protein CcdA [Isoptericola sp. b441]|uniref:Cytochrome c biogenesis protein CcdA n=1 Tax=Actinotalea lenta TaxID=3064654 RepID=A0ABT9D8N7_9CELL|nr:MULTISPECIES: cytochrome c biogenesis protein CcdA [unclassified Isoptericola]MDO8106493.1 cytochrome c biogenesis protein CcdA [Isoptericola sp. b441]MDO8121791.1 cytochrome c biogenesis protein CcdA [Isoptericola sp. b490]